MSNIEWTDETWNPVRGCSRVSPGCDNCYAMGQAHRFSGAGKPYEGLTTIRRGKVDWAGRTKLIPEMLDQPLRWKRPRRIFVNSMSDLFHESLTNEEIAAVFGVMAAAPQHTFQVLTKRPKRMVEWFEWVESEGPSLHPLGAARGVRWYAWAMYGARLGAQFEDRVSPGWSGPMPSWPWPLPNVWLGVSTENQEQADKRIPLLLQVPAAVRFVSAEPLLGPLDLEPYLTQSSTMHMALDIEGVLRNPRKWLQDACRDDEGRLLTVDEAVAELKKLRDAGAKRVPLGTGCDQFDDQTGCKGHPEPRLDWVIVGGESGHGARPCALEWIEGILDQCRAAGVACFIKQLGSNVHDTIVADEVRVNGATVLGARNNHDGTFERRLGFSHKKGGDPAEWPEALRVRQFPGGRLG
jgi:protein gp37